VTTRHAVPRGAHARYLVSLLVIFGAIACRESGRVDAATLEHTATGVRLRVTILGSPADPRVAPAREAVAHWSNEFLRLGRQLQLDSGTVRDRSVPNDVVAAAVGRSCSGEGRPLADFGSA
jgi:hypothetical protein